MHGSRSVQTAPRQVVVLKKMRTDSKHIALEKVRQTLNILRKSSIGSTISQVPALYVFADLVNVI
jgi:hypothetical protein